MKNFETNYGKVSVRSIMMDDGTNLFEGIEVKGDDVELFEVEGYRDVDDMSVDEVESIIENN